MQINHINNRYKIIKQLGEGGMGSVLLAQDLANSNRLTAIKTIKSKFLANPESLVRFKHEYEIMNRLQHPNLAQVYDFGELEEGGFYLAMEYIDGRELNEIISQNKNMQIREAIPIIIDLLRAMEFIHSRNIIYYDIKPQNVLIIKDNCVKLIDFGLSDFGNKSTNNVKGTMKYIAPEVINGEAKDYRADIFSLGVLFYEMLSGEIFYPDSSVASIVSTLTSKQEYKSLIDIAFENLKDSRIRAIIEQMCAFDPRDRFSSCAEIIMALNSALDIKIPIETEETKEAFVTGVPFTGREKELNYLQKFLGNLENKLLLVTGKQGVGKSRLFGEFQKQCNMDGVLFFQGSSTSGEVYEPFLSIVSEVLFLFGDKISEQRKKYLHKLLPAHPLFASIIPVENDSMESKTLKNILVETISAVIIDYSSYVKNQIALVFNNFSKADEISLELVNEILYKIQTNNTNNLRLYAECHGEEQKDINDFLNKLQDKDRLKIIKVSEFSEAEVSSYIKNTFGAKSIDRSLLTKTKEIFNYSGGSPLFLQELLKSLVADQVITRTGRLWELKGSLTDVKLNDGVKSIIKKRIANLKLNFAYQKALIFISFSNQENLRVDFFQQFAKTEIDIDWQSLFDLLVKKEFLVFKDGFFTAQNQVVREVLHEMLAENDVLEYQRLWVKVLEKKCPVNFKIEEIDNELLFDLSHHYLNSKYTDIDVFLSKTATFVFELGKRDKSKYANKTAINYFNTLLTEIEKFDQTLDMIQRFKLPLYFNIANIYNLVGKWDKAEDFYLKVHDLAIKTDNKKNMIDTNCYLAKIVSNKGRVEEAMILLNEAKSLAESISDKKSFATVLGYIGVENWRKGEYDNAMLCYEEQKKISLELEDKHIYSMAIGNMGLIYWNKGYLDKAMQCYEEQKKISLEIGDRGNYSLVISNIGNVYNNQGDYDLAIKFYEERKEYCVEVGDKNGYSMVIGNIGNIYCIKGDYEMAMLCYKKKNQICLEQGDKRGYSAGLANIGTVYQAQDDFETAMLNYDEAIDICRNLKSKLLLCYVLNSKADLLFVMKDYDNARFVNQEANQLSTEISNEDGVFDSMILNSKLLALENPDAALLQLNEMLKDDTDESNLASVYYEIYSISKSEDSRQKSLQLYQELYSKTPNYEYKGKIDELNANKPHQQSI